MYTISNNLNYEKKYLMRNTGLRITEVWEPQDFWPHIRIRSSRPLFTCISVLRTFWSRNTLGTYNELRDTLCTKTDKFLLLLLSLISLSQSYSSFFFSYVFLTPFWVHDVISKKPFKNRCMNLIFFKTTLNFFKSWNLLNTPKMF